MMKGTLVLGITSLLFSMGLGFFVCKEAGNTKGRIRLLGYLVGGFIILYSLSAIICATVHMHKIISSGKSSWHCPVEGILREKIATEGETKTE